MRKKDIQQHKLPDAPGVYLFKDAGGNILYVGKATSLRSRVRNYFSSDLAEKRGQMVARMVEEAVRVEVQETDSVLEALLLEANFIKKHQPPANTRDKDNKSFNYVVITNEEYPRVLAVRGRELFSAWSEKDSKYVFGPFSSGGALKDALKIIRKIFPYRDKCIPNEGTPCFNRQIGLCPGLCSGEVTKREYAKTVQHIRNLFEGRKDKVLKNIERDMKRHARNEEFEKAEEKKRQFFALTHVKETALLGSDYKVSAGDGDERIEAYDIAHISEASRVGVMVVVADGEAQKGEYRKFTIKTKKQGDVAALEETLQRRFAHTEWDMPSLIVIDGGVAQKNATKRILDEFGYKIPVVNVVKNEKHQPQRIVGDSTLVSTWHDSILFANSEAHRFAISFFRYKSRKDLSK